MYQEEDEGSQNPQEGTHPGQRAQHVVEADPHEDEAEQTNTGIDLAFDLLLLICLGLGASLTRPETLTVQTIAPNKNRSSARWTPVHPPHGPKYYLSPTCARPVWELVAATVAPCETSKAVTVIYASGPFKENMGGRCRRILWAPRLLLFPDGLLA